jgi:hypothetical protein
MINYKYSTHFILFLNRLSLKTNQTNKLQQERKHKTEIKRGESLSPQMEKDDGKEK